MTAWRCTQGVSSLIRRSSAPNPTRKVPCGRREGARSLEGRYRITLERGKVNIDSQESRVGAKVKMRQSHGRAALRGLVGTVARRWGSRFYEVLEVHLEDGRS